MRLIQVAVPEGKIDAVVETLEEADFEYTVTDETSGREYSNVVSFPVEEDGVEDALERLREAGVEREGYTVVTDTETVVSRKLEEKREEEEEEDGSESEEGEDENATDSRISREEMISTAREMTRSKSHYVLFTLLSSVVATAGLLTDSAAVVVGSMVIAPLIGPPIASSVGTVVRDDELFYDGVKLQLVGVVVAVASAAVFAAFARFVAVPHIDLRLLRQVNERVNPGILSLTVALGSGIAGALSLTSGMSTALVGVMIAAALIPPAATVGLGIAYFDYPMAVSAGLLVLVNVLSINLASLATFWAEGYRPKYWFEEEKAKSTTLRRMGVLLIVVLIMSSVLGATTGKERQNAEIEETVRMIGDEMDVEVLSVEVSYSSGVVYRDPEEIVVRVADGNRGIAEEMKSRLTERIGGNDIRLVVIHEDTESAV
ncbi:MAG: TIGR00341 family protein [Halobacteria archaeon]|nr:TIGR00341 family protein [Halobacteria archaeon]